MYLGRLKFTPHQIADLAILCALAGFVVWYALDAYRSSSHIMNLILIMPVTAIVLIMCLFEFITQFKGKRSQKKNLEPVATMFPVIGLFVFYVLTLRWLGFDFGTFIFLSLFLYLYGERRWAWILGYSLVFSLLAATAFAKILPYPMPMLFLATAY